MDMICEFCGKSFKGRINRRTCSLDCRSKITVLRKPWDRKFRFVKFCETHASWPMLTPEERINWHAKADEAREKLLAKYGPRP